MEVRFNYIVVDVRLIAFPQPAEIRCILRLKAELFAQFFLTVYQNIKLIDRTGTYFYASLMILGIIGTASFDTLQDLFPWLIKIKTVCITAHPVPAVSVVVAKMGIAFMLQQIRYIFVIEAVFLQCAVFFMFQARNVEIHAEQE